MHLVPVDHISLATASGKLSDGCAVLVPAVFGAYWSSSMITNTHTHKNLCKDMLFTHSKKKKKKESAVMVLALL